MVRGLPRIFSHHNFSTRNVHLSFYFTTVLFSKSLTKSHGWIQTCIIRSMYPSVIGKHINHKELPQALINSLYPRITYLMCQNLPPNSAPLACEPSSDHGRFTPRTWRFARGPGTISPCTVADGGYAVGFIVATSHQLSLLDDCWWGKSSQNAFVVTRLDPCPCWDIHIFYNDQKISYQRFIIIYTHLYLIYNIDIVYND